MGRPFHARFKILIRTLPHAPNATNGHSAINAFHSSRMTLNGFVPSATRAGNTLAISTAPSRASGAASHTHTAGTPALGLTCAIQRATTRDRSNPATVPAAASRPPSVTTCRTSRHPCDPSATRTPNSRRR